MKKKTPKYNPYKPSARVRWRPTFTEPDVTKYNRKTKHKKSIYDELEQESNDQKNNNENNL